jgi:asparagine synthase (glutamine-hydrolysing)
VNSVAVADYLGCYGRVDFGATPARVGYAAVPFGNRPAPATGGQAVQWLHPDANTVLKQPGDQEFLLLSGVVTGPVSPEWVRDIAVALREGRYADLRRVPGDLAGVLVTPDQVYLFRNMSSVEGLMYRRSGALFRWSTDPTDLLDEGCEEFDLEAIWRCCRGDQHFIYRNLTPVRPGEVVIADRHGISKVDFDPVIPLEVPRRTSLAEYAELTYDLILDAVRPYAAGGRVGIMLSGGVDSASVLCALADLGADVVAYHYASDDPLADESGNAKSVCERFGVPFVPVEVDTGDGYLSDQWVLPHPFTAYAFRWLEQLAERAHSDGIRLMTWGREGDMIFGPGTGYGLYNLLRDDVSLPEKLAVCQGLVSSRWELSRLLKSIVPSAALNRLPAPSGDTTPRTDFLTPLTVPDDRFDFEYATREHTMDLTSWRPRGTVLANPLGDRNLRRLSARLPQAYRLLPHQGALITKPVLRLALSDRLPGPVWRKCGRLYLQSPHKTYALNHPEVFARLLGRPDSELVRRGVVDPDRLATVLSEPALLRRNTQSLIASAMTELFLRSHRNKTYRTGKGERGVLAASG